MRPEKPPTAAQRAHLAALDLAVTVVDGADPTAAVIRLLDVCGGPMTALVTVAGLVRVDLAPPLPGRRRARQLAPCGTHSAFNRHAKHGKVTCPPCITGERIYQRDKARRRRAAAKQEAA